MKKLIIGALMSVLVSPAIAGDWVKQGENNEGSTYHSPGSAVRKGNIASQWVVVDYNVEQRVKTLTFTSVATLREYDCSKRKHRSFSSVLYSGHMINGTEVYRVSSSEWKDVIPTTIAATEFAEACK